MANLPEGDPVRTAPHFLETIMKTRIVYPAGIGVCLSLLALSVGGQTTSGNPSPAATSPTKTATASPTTSAATKAPAASASTTQKHHATAHHHSKAQHNHMAAASPTENQETAYHAALKQCVAGPAGQRESCLDGAIARFGRA